MKTVHSDIKTVRDFMEALKSFPQTADVAIVLGTGRAETACSGGIFGDLKMMQNDGGTVVLC